MALDVFFEVVVPLLEMETTALIAISTPLDGLNFYSEMFDLKGADGKPLFNTLRVGLSCAKCQAEGKSAQCTRTYILLTFIFFFSLTNNFNRYEGCHTSVEKCCEICKYLSSSTSLYK